MSSDREIFECPEGSVFTQADYSGIELRIFSQMLASLDSTAHAISKMGKAFDKLLDPDGDLRQNYYRLDKLTYYSLLYGGSYPQFGDEPFPPDP